MFTLTESDSDIVSDPWIWNLNVQNMTHCSETESDSDKCSDFSGYSTYFHVRVYKVELYLGHENKEFGILSATDSESASEQCDRFCKLLERKQNLDRTQCRSVWTHHQGPGNEMNEAIVWALRFKRNVHFRVRVRSAIELFLSDLKLAIEKIWWILLRCPWTHDNTVCTYLCWKRTRACCLRSDVNLRLTHDF